MRSGVRHPGSVRGAWGLLVGVGAVVTLEAANIMVRPRHMASWDGPPRIDQVIVIAVSVLVWLGATAFCVLLLIANLRSQDRPGRWVWLRNVAWAVAVALVVGLIPMAVVQLARGDAPGSSTLVGPDGVLAATAVALMFAVVATLIAAISPVTAQD